MIPSWSPKPPEWTQEEKSLLPSVASLQSSAVPEISLETILTKSDAFPRKFPVDRNRCKFLKSKIPESTLTRNINSAYPLVHENILHLYIRYILYKRLHGNRLEKEVFKDMTLVEFIDRLLTKRAVSFYGKRDVYSLIDGTKGNNAWVTIGQNREKEPLTLKNCLSYEEIKLSAFLSVSSYTHFLNVGDRKNMAVYNDRRYLIQLEGVIIGLIGPRLVKELFMDYQELIITKNQNTKSNGYGKVSPQTVHQLFTKLYEEDDLDYDEVTKNQNPERYLVLKSGEIFDNYVYHKRLLFSIDTLLFEANERAARAEKPAFVHVVGIGLGLWKKSASQEKIFMHSFAQRLEELGENLHHISDIRFAYINQNCGSYKNGDTIPIKGHPLKGIKIHIDKKDPHELLTGSDAGKLLVVSYAWDGNALPGNEYWDNKLGSSGDSAAASSTQISELHNPFVNPKVSAVNTMIVTGSGIVSLKDYVESLNEE